MGLSKSLQHQNRKVGILTKHNHVELGTYQHYKNREFYKVTGTRINKTTGIHDGGIMVDYESIEDGKKYSREINNFCEVVLLSGKTPVNRFTLMEGKS